MHLTALAQLMLPFVQAAIDILVVVAKLLRSLILH